MSHLLTLYYPLTSIDDFPEGRNLNVYESYLESEPVDLAHGDESRAAAAEAECHSLDGPVGDELAGADVGELGQVHDAAPTVLADPTVAATLGIQFLSRNAGCSMTKGDIY